MSKPLRSLLTVVGLLCLMGISVPARATEPPAKARFFLMGDGKLSLHNVQTDQEVQVSLLTPEGRVDEAALRAVDAVFGLKDADMAEHISERLLFMLDYFSDLVAPGKPINLVSGYRSPEHNASLRDAGGNVAKTSVHMDAMALDFNIPGVNGRELWSLIKDRDCGGVGYYGGDTIHLDASRPRFWEAATSGVHTAESDFNRKMYLSTDYDRYRAGEPVRLTFTSVSDFGFGVAPRAHLVSDGAGQQEVATAEIHQEGAPSECLSVRDRAGAHHLVLQLPQTLPEGRYRLRIDYCQRPFPEMPTSSVSNEIEIVSSSHLPPGSL